MGRAIISALVALAANAHTNEVKIIASDAVSNDQCPAEEGRETRAIGDDVPRVMLENYPGTSAQRL